MVRAAGVVPSIGWEGEIDPRERTKLWQEALLAAFKGLQTGLWTSLPGIIVDCDAADMTVTVQPSIQGKQRSPTGEFTDITITNCIKCPVLFPGGGGFLLTFPLVAGDEVILVFASRCIDSWWQNGGVQPQAEMHMHDLSDGFALPKLYSVPNAPAGVSTTTAQFRSLDGTLYIELASGGVANIVAPGGLNITAPTVKINGVTLNVP